MASRSSPRKWRSSRSGPSPRTSSSEPNRAGSDFIRRGALRARFDRLVDDAGFEVPADAVVGSLPIAKQQHVEILRALAREAELIVFDEPTASLSAGEVERFHEIVRRLAAGGRTVILVSHFLTEVLALADTITILRDGRVVRTGPAAGETEDTLVAAMLGRSIGRTYPAKQPPAADAPGRLGRPRPHRRRRCRTSRWRFASGEIVALAGLVGAGRSELARAIYGAVPVVGGQLSAGSTALSGRPDASIRAGVAMIPESRKDDGLMLGRPVRENVSLASLPKLGRLGFVRRRAETARVRSSARAGDRGSRRSIRRPTALSGGNQQKLLFARAILADPRVLIADEPTRGVDVGAKRDLYELLVIHGRPAASRSS